MHPVNRASEELKRPAQVTEPATAGAWRAAATRALSVGSGQRGLRCQLHGHGSLARASVQVFRLGLAGPLLCFVFTRDFKPMLSGSPLRFPRQRCGVERLSLCPAPETCCFLLEAVRQSGPSCLTHQPASRSRSLSLVGATFGPSSTPLGVLLSFSLPLALGHRQSLTGSPLSGPRASLSLSVTVSPTLSSLSWTPQVLSDHSLCCQPWSSEDHKGKRGAQ